MDIKINDVFILQDGVEAVDGGPSTVYFPESCEVICEEIRETDILLTDGRGAGFYLNKDEIDELLVKVG